MADKKISQLTGATTPLTGTEEIAIVQGGSTVKATAQDVADLTGPSYKVYTALLTQTGTNAPVATVLENTINPVTWSRTDVGQYLADCPNGFLFGKTVCLVYANSNDVQGGIVQVKMECPSDDTVILEVGIGDYADGAIINLPIEIRVYP